MAISRRRNVGRGFAAGYGALAGFFLLELVTRQQGTASSLTASADDRQTTRRVASAYVLAASSAPLVRLLPLPLLPRVMAPVGLGIELSGLAIRMWAMSSLGASYTRTLRADAGQSLVTSGPYRHVRHPGYLGSLLTWTGFALTSRSPAVIVVVGGLLSDAYRRRIAAEEALLTREHPDYPAYAAGTRKLIPLIW